MRQSGIALSYKHAAGEPIGNSGDPYDGVDCPSLRSRPANRLRMTDAAIAAKQRLGYRKDEDGTVVLDQTRANNKDSRADWREARQTARMCSPQGGRAERRRDHQLQQLTQIDGSSALIA
jgi:hypothetical protein